MCQADYNQFSYFLYGLVIIFMATRVVAGLLAPTGYYYTCPLGSGLGFIELVINFFGSSVAGSVIYFALLDLLWA